MKRKIFLRFFSVTLASTLIMFIFGFVAMNLNAERVMQERLIEETQIVALMLDSKEDFEKFKAYEGDDRFRVTVLDTDGNVLLDSSATGEMENHMNRDEIQNALNGTPQTVTRYSETFGCEMTYYAEKVSVDGGDTFILRLAVQSSELSPYLSVILPLFVIVLLVALVLSVIISHFISLNISEKIVDVGQSLKSINRGEYAPIKADTSEPELYSVLCEINELNESTHTHLRELEREQRKLTKVLEGISQGIIAVNDKKEVVFVNKTAADIFHSDKNLVGKDFLFIINDINIYNRIARHIFENYSFECEHDERILSVAIHEVAKDDLKISSIIIITDITGERAIAKQKSEFFANASHELKTPITVMQGLSELLLEDEGISDGAAKRVERIHKESLRLGSLISDMLKLSKLESGDEPELVFTSVRLGEIFDEVFEELREKMAKNGISYSVTGDAVISGDPKKLYELAQNLCSNAVNYNKENGSISVNITSTENQVCLSVTDTGIGIEKKHLPLLCQRFYRVDKSHSKKTGGTGLGLAIVKHICALYGATLNIESELDQGTTVTVTFKK